MASGLNFIFVRPYSSLSPFRPAKRVRNSGAAPSVTLAPSFLRSAVLERRLLEQLEAASVHELLGRRVGLVGRLRDVGLARDDGQDRAGVLRVQVDLARGERLVGDLGGADVGLQVDAVALGLERLLVELAEDELLGEVLGTQGDGGLAL